MPEERADIALLTDRRYVASRAAEGDWYLRNILQEDGLLTRALATRGLSAMRVDWADPEIDWSKFKCAVFRTTWDYFDRWPEFMAWLNRVAQVTSLCNSEKIVWWNVDKHYLGDLKTAGIEVVPCRFVERGSSESLTDVLDETGWEQAVVKPCISGAARHTYRIDRSNVVEVEPIVRQLLTSESLIVQPFQQNVLVEGEYTLMVMNGRFTHAIQKIAKPGDFRVQDDFGGTVHDYQPTLEQIAFAERAFAACPSIPAYGRIDMVRNNDGQWAVMELELIEPELWMRLHPPAAELFADAIVSRLATNA